MRITDDGVLRFFYSENVRFFIFTAVEKMNSGWIRAGFRPPARISRFSYTQFLPIRLSLLVPLVLMAAPVSLSRSIQFHQPVCLPRPFSLPKPHFQHYTNHSLKSRPCPIWSSSFSVCLLRTRRRSRHHPLPGSIRNIRPNLAVRSLSDLATTTSAEMADVDGNPLLKEFDFPPFDVIEAKHVRPGIRAILKQLVCVSIRVCVLPIKGRDNLIVYTDLLGFGFFIGIGRSVIWRNWGGRWSRHGQSWWSRWRR